MDAEIETEAAYSAALDRVYRLMDIADTGSPEEAEMIALCEQIEAYEAKHYSMEDTDNGQ